MIGGVGAPQVGPGARIRAQQNHQGHQQNAPPERLERLREEERRPEEVPRGQGSDTPRNRKAATREEPRRRSTRYDLLRLTTNRQPTARSPHYIFLCAVLRTPQ